MTKRLEVHQALWAMQGLGASEMPLGQKFDRVAAAGFQGITLDLGALSWPQALETIPHFARTQLAAGLTAFPASADELRRCIELAHRIRAPFLVVIGQHMPVRLHDMVAVIEQWLRVAESNDMPIHFETHRNCITNDLFTTVQLLQAVPAMRVAADLSHYVVDREMPCPPTAQLNAMLDQVLERAESFQGRVAARGQIQIPLDFAQNAKWVNLFKAWWRQGFEAWATRHADGDSLVFVCELGPPDYALTDAAGREMSDRWIESLTLAQWARDLWREVGATDA